MAEHCGLREPSDSECFEIRPAGAGKGFGVFATRKIDIGESFEKSSHQIYRYCQP